MVLNDCSLYGSYYQKQYYTVQIVLVTLTTALGYSISFTEDHEITNVFDKSCNPCSQIVPGQIRYSVLCENKDRVYRGEINTKGKNLQVIRDTGTY